MRRLCSICFKVIVKPILGLAASLVAFTALLVIIYPALVSLISASAREQLDERGYATGVENIYMDAEDTGEAELIGDVLERLPPTVSAELRDNWTFWISESFFLSSSGFHGMTVPSAKVIWLKPGFTEETLVHEIGHAVAKVTNADRSGDCARLYSVFMDECLKWEGDVPNKAYHVSNPSEFFTFIFTRYIRDPADLEESFPEGYDYMAEICGEFDNTGLRAVRNSALGIYNVACSFGREVGRFSSSLLATYRIDENVKDNGFIDVTRYEPVISTGGMDEREVVLFYDIFDVVCNVGDYPVGEHNGEPVIILQYDEGASDVSYGKIAACIDFYLGKESADIFDVVIYRDAEQRDMYTHVYIYVEKLAERKQARDAYEAKIEEALAGMREGTEAEKLLQICRYIGENCTHVPKDGTSSADFWVHAEGDDVTRAMIFRQFCERLGIQCDLVFGKLESGEYRVWNRVKTEDGSYRFYDLTDSGTADADWLGKRLVESVNSYVPY